MIFAFYNVADDLSVISVVPAVFLDPALFFFLLAEIA